MAAKSLKQLIQREAYTVVFLQAAGVAVIALFAWFIAGNTSGLSVLLGGAAYCLPNLFFVWRVFRYAGAQQMSRFVAAFFLGEALKLVLSAILFLLIVNYLPVSLLSTLIGFIGAIIAFWVACMWHFSRQDSQKGVAND